MARSDGKPENQHYVPEMLLRNFAVEGGGKRPQIHVFDKVDERTFLTSTGNVAVERKFYEAAVGGGYVASLEHGLADLETAAKAPLTKLVSTRRLDSLTAEDRAWLSMFIAAQYLRGKNFREVQIDLDAKLAEWIEGQGLNPDRVKGLHLLRGEEEAKLLQMSFVSRRGKDLALMVAAKQWVLFETDMTRPFWLSDNPVALHNEIPAPPPMSNIGFLVPGIQIYLPLSPTLMLGAWCFSWAARITDDAQRIEDACVRLQQTWKSTPLYSPRVDDVILSNAYREKRELLSKTTEAIRVGTPAPAPANTVDFFNALQLRWAERQVYSATDSFALAREILRKDEGFRTPVRWSFG